MIEKIREKEQSKPAVKLLVVKAAIKIRGQKFFGEGAEKSLFCYVGFASVGGITYSALT